MTDKVALVRLRAKNDQYDAAMARSKKATDDLAATSTRFAGMSDKLGEVGSNLNRSVTLPLALAGAASFKLAKDFNTTFTQMATLAGVPVSELEGLKQSVLDLAGETGQAPAELAESLYQIYSSGVPASEAMNVLRASAQGAALGLGEAAGVADAVTAAMNTYGAGNLSAAEATDQLTAAVKAGKGEASELAPQLGNLLPLANELGISFADTAGSLAFLTRGGNNAATASTKLEGVMKALVKPTTQAREVLESVNGSAEDLKAIVAADGLPAGLEYLAEKFDGNNVAMGKFFEDSEGYIGNLALMKDGGKEWSQVLQEVNDSQGLVAEGMALLQETPEFQAQQALAELQATAIEVGTQLMPIVATLAGGFADLASVFGALPGPVQFGLVAVAGFAAALGPIVSLAGNAAKAVSLFARAMDAKQLNGFRLGLMGLTEAGGGASNALGGLIASAGGMGIVMGTAGGILGGAALILWDYSVQAARAEAATKNLRMEAERTGQTISETFADQLARLFAGAEGGYNIGPSDDLFRKVLDSTGIGIKELSDALNGSEEDWQRFVDKVAAGAAKVGGSSAFQPVKVDLDQLRKAQEDATHQSDALAAAQRALGVDTETSADKQVDLTTATDTATDALSAQADAILGILDGQRSAADATQAYNDSIIAVSDAQQAEKDAAAAVTAAEGELADAHERAAEQAADNAKAVRQAEAALADALKGREQALRSVSEAEADAADAAENVTSAVEDLAVAQREATGDSDAMRDAVQKVADAEQNLEDAQADSLTAQQDLTEARANYSQVLAGLARDAGGAADDVLSAEIRLRESQQALADLGKPDANGNSKPVSADERLAAEIAIREAQRRLEEAKERAAEAQAEYERNEAAGVDGSDAVVAAHDAVTAAANNEATAEQEVANAREGVTAVQEAAAQRVIDAQGRVEDALNDRAAADQRVVDAKDSVMDANARVAEAVDGVNDANARAAKSTDDVATAQANLNSKKDALVTAQGEVEKKLDDVRDAALEMALAIYEVEKKNGDVGTATEILAGKLRAQAAQLGPNDPLRAALLDTADALDNVADDYVISINLGGNAAQAILDGTLGDLFAALDVATDKQVSGGKGGVEAGANGVGTFNRPQLPTGWVQQPNGRWYHPRGNGEQNYGDGYSDSRYTPHNSPAFAGQAAATASRTVDVGGVHVDARGIQNPYAMAMVTAEKLAHKMDLEDG